MKLGADGGGGGGGARSARRGTRRRGEAGRRRRGAEKEEDEEGDLEAILEAILGKRGHIGGHIEPSCVVFALLLLFAPGRSHRQLATAHLLSTGGKQATAFS